LKIEKRIEMQEDNIEKVTRKCNLKDGRKIGKRKIERMIERGEFGLTESGVLWNQDCLCRLILHQREKEGGLQFAKTMEGESYWTGLESDFMIWK
jgi:hypothetical protein